MAELIKDYWIADAMLRAAGDWLTDWVELGLMLWMIGAAIWLLARKLLAKEE